MIVSPGVFAFFVCCVFSSQTTSKPLDPTADDRINQGVLEIPDGEYQVLLMTALPAASSGKNSFNVREKLSEDCVRTAKAFMSLFVKPSKWPLFDAFLPDIVSKISLDRRNTTFQKQVELLCTNLNEQMKTKIFDSVTFEELKKKVELPKPAKNYMWEIPPGMSMAVWSREKAKVVNDGELIKYYMTVTFQLAGQEGWSELFPVGAAAAKAITQLSGSGTLKSTVDDVFVEALDDFAGDFLRHNTTGMPDFDAFARKVDENFLKNSVLQEEYQKIKKQSDGSSSQY